MPKTINQAIPAGAEGRVAIGHSDEQVAKLRAVTAEARHRQASGLAPQGSPVTGEPAGPAGPVLPYIGSANAALGRELALLRAQADDRERWLSSSGIGAGGMPMMHQPGYATQRQAVCDELEAIREAIARLEALTDDQAVRSWAHSRGVL